MGKYEPLGDFLESQRDETIPMTFDEIEKLLGVKLPASKQYPAWWSNSSSNNPMTQEWLDAGYKTENVNIPGERVVFRRVKIPAPVPAKTESEISPGARHPIFGCMKGMLTIAPGYDVAAPLDEDWGEVYLGLETQES